MSGCPFGAKKADEPMDISEPAAAAAPAAPPLPEALATAVVTMAASGMTAEAIAPMMKLDLAAVKATLAARPVDVSDAGGKCPFGFDKKPGKPVASAVTANPALLVETLRERFNARRDRAAAGASSHVQGRVLGDARQV